jgi:hypothetical protein
VTFLIREFAKRISRSFRVSVFLSDAFGSDGSSFNAAVLELKMKLSSKDAAPT